MQQHISVGRGKVGNNNNSSGFATTPTKSQQHLQQHHAQHSLLPKPLFVRLDKNNNKKTKNPPMNLPYAQIV